MATSCQLTGKRTQSGFNKSHSNRRTKRTFKPNLQTKRVKNPKTGRMVKLTLSTTAIKTLKKWDEAGKIYDLDKLIAQR